PFGYRYAPDLDKWHIDDGAADYLFLSQTFPDFALPASLEIILRGPIWESLGRPEGIHQGWFPDEFSTWKRDADHHEGIRFLIWDLEADGPIDQQWVNQMQADPAFALCLGVRGEPVMGELRAQIDRIKLWGGTFPIIL